MGLGQKPSGHRPQTKALWTKSPPKMNCKSYLYIGIFAHILDLLYRYLWVNITFEYYFHYKLLLELEDIINNWNICLRIIITLIKESKNKICFILKKIIIV